MSSKRVKINIEIFLSDKFAAGAPVLFVGPWVVVRATLENVL